MQRYEMDIEKTSHVPFFKGFSRDDLAYLQNACTEYGFEPGEVIKDFGQQPSDYWVLLDGGWTLEVQGGASRDVERSEVSWVGPQEGVDPAPLKVSASKTSYVLNVPKDVMQKLKDDKASVKRNLQKGAEYTAQFLGDRDA